MLRFSVQAIAVKAKRTWADLSPRYQNNTALDIATVRGHATVVQMIESHQPRAAARDLVACQQRLALSACFAPGARFEFALPDDVLTRITGLPMGAWNRPARGVPVAAGHELPWFPRIAAVSRAMGQRFAWRVDQHDGLASGGSVGPRRSKRRRLGGGGEGAKA